MTPRAYSNERVRMDSSIGTRECAQEVSRFEDILNEIDQMGEVGAVHQEDKTDIVCSVFSNYGFGAVGDSNSVWGRQERLDGSSKEAKEDLISTCRRLGFIIQSIPDDVPQRADREMLYVFVPDFNRYFPFNHPVNEPDFDIVLAKNDGKGYVEVCCDDEVLLESIRDNVFTQAERLRNGVLRYESREARSEVKTELEGRGLSYAVYDSYIGSVPVGEYSPQIDERDMFPVFRDRSAFGISRTVHALNNDRRLKCGAGLDIDEATLLTPERISSMLEDGYVEECGHPACQKMFNSVI